MNNLMKLFTLAVALPIRIINLIMINFDLVERANTIGVKALNVELDQVEDSLDQRSQALTDKQEQLAAARKARSEANVTKRVSSIQADFE